MNGFLRRGGVIEKADKCPLSNASCLINVGLERDLGVKAVGCIINVSHPEGIALQITRRDFLNILILAPVVGVTVSHADNKGRLTVSSLNITVPVWLFDKKSKEKTKVKALAIEENKEAKEIVVLFEGNRQVMLSSGTSVQGLLQANANRPNRESMLLKRIISYSFDAMFSNLAGKRHPEMGT